MKNHFIYPYAGNKRNEATHLISNIPFENIKNILEPFCGSSAISYQIWLKYGDEFNYYLNDKNDKLINIYNILINESLEKIEQEVNNIKDSITNKEQWTSILKNDNSPYHYIFFQRYSMKSRYGFWPCDFDKKCKLPFKITDETKKFIQFLKSPNTHISSDDWINIFDKFKDDTSTIIILDPPYLQSCNSFYTSPDVNIYEYLFNNRIENYESKIYLILENSWIIKMLFRDNKKLIEYNKKYEISKKKTTHIIIENVIC